MFGLARPLHLEQAGKDKEPLEMLYQVGPLLGSGGFGSVYLGTRLSDSDPVAIKHVDRNQVSNWGELVSVLGRDICCGSALHGLGSVVKVS
ncbi:hypothetical protein KIL84_009456 [Mauremys mutica]|uniref:non-specific serine/threonine protein kinase n=1 Tax=Mauremys mutica TaxID=74926 RepID=A0A9D3WN65_9SAUR|nr:hypothetical protein KIL84_009456 [Mauremys mutica]